MKMIPKADKVGSELLSHVGRAIGSKAWVSDCSEPG